MVEVAQHHARLCTVAQFLGRAGRRRDSDGDLLGARFEAAREAMRSLHGAISRGDLVAAEGILERIDGNETILEAALAEADELCSIGDFEALLGDGKGLTADLVRHLLEHYTRLRLRSEGACLKASLVARAFAVRDGIDEPDASAITQVFRRRKLLGADPLGVLEPALRSAAAAIRQRLAVLGRSDPHEISAITEEIRRYPGELGDALFIPEGLAQAVALHLALGQRREQLERCEDQSLALMLSEVEGLALGDAAGDAVSPEAAEGDDPEAIDLLRETDARMREAAARGALHESFPLDAGEIKAIGECLSAGGHESGSLILRSSVCRAAIDRLARRHARSAQPEGVEPPPLPTQTALTLIRRAAELEGDFEDFIQRSLSRGDIVAAKAVTRTLHKLVRSKLGLALLGDLPVRGREPSSAEPAPSDPESRPENDEAELRAKLEVAVLMRDALVRDSHGGEESGPAAAAMASPSTSPSAKPGHQRSPGKWEGVIRRHPFHATFVVVGLLTCAFHAVTPGWGRAGSAGSAGSAVTARDLAAVAPLASVVAVRDAWIAVATIDWAGAGPTRRSEYVQTLWIEAQRRGYQKLVVLHPTEARPLAIATTKGVEVYPLEGDLASRKTGG